MAIVKVNLSERSYDIVVESGLLVNTGKEIASVCRGRAALVITDTNVGEIYAKDVLDSLSRAGMQVFLTTIPGGEQCKTLETTASLYNRLLDIRMDRSGILITLGGGVVGDIGGFVAATYLRGIDFVQVPTSLLAQVDASIGGKVGVDLPRGKNLVGSFYQPKRVLIDPDVLATLPRRELCCGLAELIKHGIIAGQELFDFIRKQTDLLLKLDRDVLEEAITRSCEIKASVVARDERESGLRAILNYGHTVGHGIEAATGFARYSHGEAVAIGMVTAAIISEVKGIATPGIADEIASTLVSVELPVVMDRNIDIEQVIAAMSYDKKNIGGKLRFILPRRIGEVVVTEDVTGEDVRSALVEQERHF